MVFGEDAARVNKIPSHNQMTWLLDEEYQKARASIRRLEEFFGGLRPIFSRFLFQTWEEFIGFIAQDDEPGMRFQMETSPLSGASKDQAIRTILVIPKNESKAQFDKEEAPNFVPCSLLSKYKIITEVPRTF